MTDRQDRVWVTLGLCTVSELGPGERVPDRPESSSLMSPSSTAFSRLLRDLLLVLKFLSRFRCSWYVIGGLSGPMWTGRGVP